MAIRVGTMRDFSMGPPLFIRRNRNGGKPKSKGTGKRRGMPWRVRASAKRCETMPIMKALWTMVMSTIRMCEIEFSSQRTPMLMSRTPMREWERVRWAPRRGSVKCLTNLPKRTPRQRLEDGPSKSGARAPM